MRWCRFGTDFFVCDCEKRKMYWMYIEFFGKKQAGKDVPKMCRRINQRFLKRMILCPASCGASLRSEEIAPPCRIFTHSFSEISSCAQGADAPPGRWQSGQSGR